MPNQCPNPEPVANQWPITTRSLAGAVVASVEGGDLRGALASAKALVTFIEGLLPEGDTTGENDNGMRAGLALVVSPAPVPGYLAPGLAA